jgi:hypothetical protein
MNTTLKKAIEFAKNLEGEATQDKIEELTQLIHCVHSEVENSANSSKSSNPFVNMKSDYEMMVYELLIRMLFMKDEYNRKIGYAINNLKS